MSERRQSEVAVIGGGVVGLATALTAARHGANVVLLERSGLATAAGSSAGSARIFTPAAHPDPSYLETGLRALAGWRALEDEAGATLCVPTGALTCGEFAERELPLLLDAGVEAELVSATEAARRFGVRVPEATAVLHQPGAGIIRADLARQVLLRSARAAGVELRERERVISIVERGDLVEVETEGGGWACSVAVVAAGPWSGALLAAAGIDLPLAASCQSVAYFEVSEGFGPPVALMDFEGDEPYACWDPVRGLKAALHARGPTIEPEHAGPQVDPAAIERVASWVGERFPGVDPSPTAVEPCLYTNTPDERFALERRGRIVVGSACNGQGFQFAPQTGEHLARLALEPAPVESEAVR